MNIIGLTGGVACGKSTIAWLLAERGAVVFDADKLGHLVLDEPAVRDALVARWGKGVLGSDGLVSRPAVARRVFGDSPAAAADRQLLEGLVHPRIRAWIERGIAQLPDASIPAVVIDAPLLVESGWCDVCKVLAFVDAPQEVRLARARERGWSADEFARREAAQMPISEKRRRCDHVIDNSGDLAHLEAETERFWSRVTADPA